MTNNQISIKQSILETLESQRLCIEELRKKVCSTDEYIEALLKGNRMLGIAVRMISELDQPLQDLSESVNSAHSHETNRGKQ